MTLKIAQLGQPILWEAAAEVSAEEIASPAFQDLLQNMRDTLREHKGAGLAAPQVFVGKRVFLAAILPPLQEEAPPEIEVFINPRIVQFSEEASVSWEGCLSFPELLVLVQRPREVRVEYLNARGEKHVMEARGFPARVIQHESDHLDGILTLDRAPSSRFIIKASEADTLREDADETGD